MNTFSIILYIVLYGLTFLCFFIPFKSGEKHTGAIVGMILAVVITLIATGNLDFVGVFILLIILVFQIIFLTYWTFRVYHRRKTGQIIATILTIVLILLVMSPWISDWTFNKKDAKEILAFHNLELSDDFKIKKNASFGFRDYHETFTLKLSDNDFNNIAQMIKNSNDYKGFFKDYSNLPSINYQTIDTIDYETENHWVREFFTNERTKNGTYHFIFQLDKQNKELSYFGSDE